MFKQIEWWIQIIFFPVNCFWYSFQALSSSYPLSKWKNREKNIDIVDIRLTFLAQSNLPLSFWCNAFQTAIFLINKLLAFVLNNVSSYFKLFFQKPDCSILRVFSCAWYPYLRPYNKHKLKFKTWRCILISYGSRHKGYNCLHSFGRVYISKHITFDEKSFPYKSDVFSPLSIIHVCQVLIMKCQVLQYKSFKHLL